MMTTLPAMGMERSDAECIMRLKNNPDWNHYLVMQAMRKREVVDLLIEGDPALDEFYKGALFMLRETILIDSVAEEVVNLLGKSE